jgi:hypothetical protein
MVRSYILTKHEKDILTRALKTGERLNGYAVLMHHLRKAQKRLEEDLELIQQGLKV